MLDLSKQASWLGIFLAQMSHAAVQATIPAGSASTHGVNHGVNHLNVPEVKWVNSDISLNYVGKDSSNDVEAVKVDFTQITHDDAAWKFDCGTVATPLYYGHTLQHRNHSQFGNNNSGFDQRADLHPEISFPENANITKIEVRMHDLYLETRTSNYDAAHHGYQNYAHNGTLLSHQPIEYWNATYDAADMTTADGRTTIANNLAAFVETTKYIKVCPMRNTTHTYEINVEALDANGDNVWSKQVEVQYTRPLEHHTPTVTNLQSRQQIYHHQQI